ncbi:MAG: Mu-like prophage major head subunit gpT family protein [Paracoccaceae bacterium]
MARNNFDAETLARLNRGFKAIFQKAFDEAQPEWMKIASRVNSNAKIETYAWLSQIPGMREWIGARVIKRLGMEAYTLANRKFEDTVAVGRDDIEDDQTGTYALAMSAMAEMAAIHPDELVFRALAEGFSNRCYDGQNFFDTDHPVIRDGREVSVSNMQAGSGPAWFLLATGRAVKPIVYQDRVAPELIFHDDPRNNHHVFMQDEVLWGARSRGAAGYGFWQMAFGSREELSDQTFTAARVAMMSQKGDEGRSLNIRPNLLVVPPELETAAEEILVVERKANGATNPHRGKVEIMVTTQLPAAA